MYLKKHRQGIIMSSKLSAQEIFERVSNHLLTQRKRSMDEYESCRYRGPGGLKCAVGCVIPDRCYNEEMEGQSVEFIKLPNSIKAHRSLLLELQDCHDDFSVKDWASRLRAIGYSFCLDISFLKGMR